MTREQIFDQILKKQSFLCVGLDPEMKKLPGHILHNEYPLYAFNRQIIDATHDLAIAYKPNLAFYECLGTEGWMQFELTVNYIRKNYPDILIIADAKRGDIGNTSGKYAEAFFKQLPCDAVTVSPYMGSDSVLPFLQYPGKWVIILALTSNHGSEDFQMLTTGNRDSLFETVLHRTRKWGTAENLMYVVGANHAAMLGMVRKIVPDHFLLIPGIGTQGGDLSEVSEYGFNRQCGIIVNSSRAILYADSTKHFAGIAREKALEAQTEMSKILEEKGIDNR